MKKMALAITVGLVFATGCDEETQTRTSTAGSERGAAQLIYSFPTQSQGNVPTSTPMFLHFSSPVTNAELDDLLSLSPVSGGDDVALSIRRINEDRTLVLTPEAPLNPATDYRVDAQGLTYGEREMRFPEDGVQFTTRAANGDVLFRQMSADPSHTDLENGQFGVMTLIPDGDNYPLTDLATLRVQFTEPLDPSTVTPDSVFIEDSSGDHVAVELRFKGPNLTIDPDEDFTPGEEYTLHLSNEVSSTLGATLNAGPYGEFRFVPEDANRSNPMPLRVIAHGNEKRSALSGELYNSVYLSSALLGEGNATFMGPDLGAGGNDSFEPLEHVFTELASVVRFTDVTPLKIPKGSLLTGTSVDVEVAGAQQAGLSSGDIEVRFLSDATGFMIANPYSSSRSAPKNLVLFVDLALNTEDTVANSALGQKLLNVPLVGTVSLDNGALSIDALSVIEPSVLGVDHASGLVSFRLEGYQRSSDGPSAPAFPETAPVITASAPGSNTDKLRPGDPLILYFDRPVSRQSLDNAITLDGTTAVNLEKEVDGSVVVLRPEEPLAHGVDYTLQVSGVRDIIGNEMTAWTDEFALAPTDPLDANSQAPLALTTTPGFPCAKDVDAQSIDADSEAQGTCSVLNRNLSQRSNDDPLPILTHPENRALVVRFSQNMDPASFVANDGTAADPTVHVEKLVDGTWEPFHDWRLDAGVRELRIRPFDGWEEGALYRYTLSSDEGAGSNYLRSEQGAPLQTRLLTDTVLDFDTRNFGGPDLVNYFRGGSAATKTRSELRNLPSVDANADLIRSGGEDRATEGNLVPNAAQLLVTNVDSGLVNSASIGCLPTESCPDNKFIYFTGMLDVDIGDQVIEPGMDERVPVDIYPSALYTTGEMVGLRLSSLVWFVGESRSQSAETGPMMMRIRYAGQDRDQPVPAFIEYNTATEQLEIAMELEVYLDAPYLEIEIDSADLDHNLRSYPMEPLQLRGPIEFLDDGRMNIQLTNQQNTEIVVNVDGDAPINPETDMTLTIPAGQLLLNYVSDYTHH